jgi:predicted kinase
MSTLILIQGFLGAGKSTFSRKLAQETSAIRYNADELVERDFSPAEQERNWNICYDHAITKIWNDAALNLQAGVDVILDTGFWTYESRDFARNFAHGHNADTKLYYIFAPDDVLIERLKKRMGPIAQKNIENFTQFKTSFEPPHPSENAIRIDNY